MTDRNQFSVSFWATVVVVVALLAYPLSFGPACWLTSRTGVGVRLIPAIYRPLIWASLANGRGATSIGAVLVWYTELGASKGWGWTSLHGVRGDPVWLDCSPDVHATPVAAGSAHSGTSAHP